MASSSSGSLGPHKLQGWAASGQTLRAHCPEGQWGKGMDLGILASSPGCPFYLVWQHFLHPANALVKTKPKGPGSEGKEGESGIC